MSADQQATRRGSPPKSGGYTEEHARAGLDDKLPTLETFPNQFPGYTIRIHHREYTSICPKTGLPDFGHLSIRYEPERACLELKSLKVYLLAYRNLGIFYENAINRILRDLVDACDPVWMVVVGRFTPRGGLSTTVRARFGPNSSASEEST